MALHGEFGWLRLPTRRSGSSSSSGKSRRHRLFHPACFRARAIEPEALPSATGGVDSNTPRLLDSRVARLPPGDTGDHDKSGDKTKSVKLSDADETLPVTMVPPTASVASVRGSLSRSKSPTSVARFFTSSTVRSGAKQAEILLEMSCDKLCFRTMHVEYTDTMGKRHGCSQSGYNVKIFLPISSVDVEVWFTVVGGSAVCKVDRSDPKTPWIKDAKGKTIAEKFVYRSCSPHIQYFICGPSFHSRVARVDERKRTESLFEMVSRDFQCIRTMDVTYTDEKGVSQQWAGSGYNVKCHLPSSARDIEVTFSVVGGRNVCRVDRRDPQLPWVEDANGQRPRESFSYARCPQCVQFDIRGPSLHSYISQVQEQHEGTSIEDVVPPSGSCAGLRLRADTAKLFAVAPEDTPAIGGIVSLQERHSEYLLPAEVALFEPSQNEIFHNGNPTKTGSRQIFLNTPLSEAENVALGEFHKLLAKRGIVESETSPFPRYMELHALRILQTCKFNASKAADMMNICVKERVRRLPVAEEDVLSDLNNGFIYWHGRDRKCRPCLVIRVERLGEMAKDKERAVRAVMFTLEYALRFALVPGRVENWVVIIDLANVLRTISPLNFGSMASTAAAIATALEKVYCGRMVWLKIVNMPGGLARIVNGLIPAEKKDKVSFPSDAAAELLQHMEPHQLERRYGGTAPDLAPDETYPFNFFKNPRGEAALSKEHPVESLSSAGSEPEDFSMHESTQLAFHEGLLWDDSSAEARARWLELSKAVSLTPDSAAALSRLTGCNGDVQPCRDIEHWLQIVNPAAMGISCTRRAMEEEDNDDTH